MKETQELRAARCNSGTSNRGARLGSDGVSYIASTENDYNGKFIVFGAFNGFVDSGLLHILAV